jgi:ABC-type Mn2+/Zn2+ transport system ATPase subunit
MLYPNSGSVCAFGLSPRKDAVAVKKRIGYVGEEQILPGPSSVAELIAFHRHVFPQWDSELEGRILDRFGLSGKSTIMRLSKGEARAVALLCAVCHRPELLLLDEPVAGLDPAARREFLEVAVQFLNREGTTILFSSHDMDDIERIGQRAIFLDGEGSPSTPPWTGSATSIALHSCRSGRFRIGVCLGKSPVACAFVRSLTDGMSFCRGHRRTLKNGWAGCSIRQMLASTQ